MWTTICSNAVVLMNCEERYYVLLPEIQSNHILVASNSLETVYGPGRRHAGHAGSVDGAELHIGDVEGDMGGLEPRLHHLQRTGQDGAHCTPASRRRRRKGRYPRTMERKFGTGGCEEEQGEEW